MHVELRPAPPWPWPRSLPSAAATPGRNSVCVHVVDGALANVGEARNCVAVAYIPD